VNAASHCIVARQCRPHYLRLINGGRAIVLESELFMKRMSTWHYGLVSLLLVMIPVAVSLMEFLALRRHGTGRPLEILRPALWGADIWLMISVVRVWRGTGRIDLMLHAMDVATLVRGATLLAASLFLHLMRGWSAFGGHELPRFTGYVWRYDVCFIVGAASLVAIGSGACGRLPVWPRMWRHWASGLFSFGWVMLSGMGPKPM
jgi:hypothetical protein